MFRVALINRFHIGREGIFPRLQIIVNPKDFIYEDEKRVFDRLNQDIPYHSPQLPTEIEEFPAHRFAPLEHLVIETPNGLIETTSQQDTFPGCESCRKITPSEAISCVYKDLAINAGANGNIKRAKQLLNNALRLWSNNRQVYAILAKLAFSEGEKETFEENKKRFNECNGNDSYFYLQRYLLDDNPRDLEMALSIYPPYAEALAVKAASLTRSDSREARFLYALFSNLCASSSVLSYPDFLIVHAENLKCLFGARKINEVMEKIVNRKN